VESAVGKVWKEKNFAAKLEISPKRYPQKYAGFPQLSTYYPQPIYLVV